MKRFRRDIFDFDKLAPMTLFRSLPLSFVLVSIACRKDVSAHGDPVAVEAGAATGHDAGASCASIVSSYDALVAAGGACKADGDCACFSGGVSPKSGCGGVTDRATRTKLESLARDFADAKCGSHMACAAWQCAPVCQARKCGNGR